MSQHMSPAALLALLQAAYLDGERGDAGERLTLQLTEAGIWLATPLDVVAGALRHLFPLIAGQDRPLRVVDAGCGDGRWLVALALWSESHEVSLEVVGVEQDEALASAAIAHVAALTVHPSMRPEVIQGDYLALMDAPLPGRAWSVAEADLVLNYPDGNEQALASALAANESLATLWVLLARRELTLEEVHLARRHAIARPAHPALPWTLHVFHC